MIVTTTPVMTKLVPRVMIPAVQRVLPDKFALMKLALGEGKNIAKKTWTFSPEMGLVLTALVAVLSNPVDVVKCQGKRPGAVKAMLKDPRTFFRGVHIAVVLAILRSIAVDVLEHLARAALESFGVHETPVVGILFWALSVAGAYAGSFPVDAVNKSIKAANLHEPEPNCVDLLKERWSSSDLYDGIDSYLPRKCKEKYTQFGLDEAVDFEMHF